MSGLLRHVCPIVLFILFVATSIHSQTQTVLQNTDTTRTLSDRWKWAHSVASKNDFDKGYWIGYSIQRTMGERSMVGCYYSDPKRNRPSLGELITGLRKENNLTDMSMHGLGSTEGFIDIDEDKNPKRLIKKEVGILVH